MIYTFQDTTRGVTGATGATGETGSILLPAEAVSIDGQYIEEAIDGYRILYVTGRESLAAEINATVVGTADGETVKGTRYPARVLTVGFQLIASSDSDFRDKFNHLNNLLSMDEADFIINDEPDKFFTGIPIMDLDIPAGRNAVTGEYQIYCSYPFKRSTVVYEKSPTSISETSAEFTIAYNGNYPARPILRAEFAGALDGGDHTDDGDCGFVAFVDDSENIIQLGNPEALDLDPEKTASQLLNRTFSTTSGFSTTGGKTWGNKTIAGSTSANQSITDTYWKSGAGQTQKYVKPTYGSGSSWHGPILHKSYNDGFVDFDIACVHRLCVNSTKQCGSFELGAYNVDGSTYTMICGVVIEKSGSGTKGTVRYIVNGSQAGTANIDLSYYNTHFGYCKRTPVYKTQYYDKKKKKWQDKKIKKAKTRQVVSRYTYTQSNLNTTIKKSGAKVTFKVGNLAQKTFTVSAIAETVSHDISLHFGQKGSTTAFHTNAVHSLKLTRKGGPAFDDYQNVFTAGDIVEADCNDASVYIYRAGSDEGQRVPEYGALGNDWESFTLQRGVNVIGVSWSPWVNTNYKPTLKILYNEVYI